MPANTSRLLPIWVLTLAVWVLPIPTGRMKIFRTAISTNHNVSIQGGLKNMPYRVSLGFEDNNGIVKTTWMKRFNTSINVAPTFLDKHLNVNFTAKYMFEKDRYAKVGDAIGGALDH